MGLFTKLPRIAISEWETPYRRSVLLFCAGLGGFALIGTFFALFGFVAVFIVMIIMLALAITAAAVVFSALITAWRWRATPKRAVLALGSSLLAIAGALVLALPIVWATSWVDDWIRFYHNRGAMDAIVLQVENGQISTEEEGFRVHGGMDFQIDAACLCAFPFHAWMGS